MVFKKSWEKTDQLHQLDAFIIEEILAQAFPRQAPYPYESISNGCANLNFKIITENPHKVQILRVYLRDKAAAYREQKLAALIGSHVSIPKVHLIGNVDEYRFAIMEYKEGMLLRDVLLSGENLDIKNLMIEAGSILAVIQSYRFPYSGFFDNDLHISQPISQEGYIEFAKKCLEHHAIVEQISAGYISKIDHYVKKYAACLPDENQNHLVHGDFDPANILVQKRNGEWKISAILDWEFAFSGSFLTDVANMLRYAHQMAPEFEEGFLEGLQNGGVFLPQNWRISINLLNILALLDCLTRGSPAEKPNQCADIRSLISHIIQQLDKIK